MSHRPTNYLTDRVCIEAMRQSRCVSSISGPKRDYLAKLEASANAKPDSVNLQNSFYSALLLLRMPSIVIERQATGRYASNDVTIMLKGQAELDMNPGSRGRARSGLDASQAMATHTASLTDANTAETTKTSAAPAANIPTAQATNAHIARAVATLNGPGASPGLVRTKGNRGEPIHVVVDESLKTVIFRWVKFLAIFVVATYLCFALVTILVEALGTLRRGAGNAKDAEVKAEKQTTRFSDVHGCEEAKEELAEVVDFLKNPEQFSDLGAKLPKGVLLVGQPGTGKTLLARAVAGEAGVPFFYMSGSEFDEIFVGVGAKRVRDLFKTAKAKSPAIVFIDELDAIGGKRNPRDQAHAKQTLNQLLTELDGFDQDTRIIIMAATNLPKLLDKALTRPGRFDRHINVELPDYRGRFAILKHHASKIKAAPDVDFESVAARTPGRSGAELENMINVAALKASRAKASMVSKTDMEWAFDRLTMGSERRSIVITEKDKEMTAYHEAGHALVQLYDKESSATLYKITVLPKGPSLGHTAMLPVRDKYSQTAAEYLSQIRVLLGGKMAEELQYGTERSTSGVSSVSLDTIACFSWRLHMLYPLTPLFMY